MTEDQFDTVIRMFREAAEENSPESPYHIARVLGAAGFKQTDEIANAAALWAISFCGALNDHNKAKR